MSYDYLGQLASNATLMPLRSLAIHVGELQLGEERMSEVVYNVTVSVTEEVREKWLSWMQDVHIPQVLGTGFFTSATLLRVHAFEQGGSTFAVQYRSPSMEVYEQYVAESAPTLQAEAHAAFGDHAHAFRTVLEILSTHTVKS